MNNNLVFNTLVFQAKINSGLKQVELFDDILSLGFNNIEPRREYFVDIDKEIPEMRKAAESKNITLFYSVPDYIFLDDGELNPKIIEYFEEAKRLNVANVKMSIGNYRHFSQLKQLNFINDQPQQSGTINKINQFLQDAKKAKLNIGYTFDLGNFRYVQESEVDAADTLGLYVTYIHLKNLAEQDGKFIVISLDKGIIDWKSVVEKLPTGLPIGLEYPSSDVDEVLKDKQSIEVLENERK
ncbi:sugar phosphate isomerase/epimerase [Staphylococcus simulans]|uniref:sugar phosphate isomerase/epimerase family protein n=1 Tax=Staphylococcus simulans TaxID=1286 RepID=UPI000E6895AF|nr:sugar phosphate isomerase/epimerase [Staphylococcus simulans]RIN60888.1 sugar phosphate isomerase/epimerase [Staphylococcus simulans]